MKFVLNGIIRSMSPEEIEYELKKHLIGKSMNFKNETITVSDLSIKRNTLLFIDGDNPYAVNSIKKIEIEYKNKIVRIITNLGNTIIRI